jgi:DNA-binding response OmpR family regulator
MRTSIGPPDIVLLATEWRPRALLRAQLIEQGFEVVAADTWPLMRQNLRPGMKPRLALVDLMGLPDPDSVLQDLRLLMKPERVLVLTAMGTTSAANVDHLGFHALSRPIAIEQVVRAAADAIRSSEELIGFANEGEVSGKMFRLNARVKRGVASDLDEVGARYDTLEHAREAARLLSRHDVVTSVMITTDDVPPAFVEWVVY